MNDSLLLKEEIDPDYEPTEEEVVEYGKYLGLDLPEDENLLYIAREGLLAPLPENWQPCMTKEEDIYYFNFQTGESDWVHPCDKFYKDKVQQAKTGRKEEFKSKQIHKTHKERNKKKRGPLALIDEMPDSSELLQTKLQMEEEFYREFEGIKEEFHRKQLEFQGETQLELLEAKNQISEKAQNREKLEKQNLEAEAEALKRQQRLKNEQYKADRINNERGMIKLEENSQWGLEENRQQQLESTHRTSLKRREEALRKEEMVLDAELEGKSTDLEHVRQKTQLGIRDYEDLAERQQRKLRRLREDAEQNYLRSLKKLEEQYENSLDSLKGTEEDLREFERERQLNLQIEITSYKGNRTVSIDKEKTVGNEEMLLRNLLSQELEKYRELKTNQMTSELAQFKRERETQLSLAKQSLDLEIATLGSVLQQREKTLRQLNAQQSQQLEHLQRLEQGITLLDKKTVEEPTQTRLDRLEEDLLSLKQLLHTNKHSQKHFIELEKDELQEKQKQLKNNRDYWKTQVTDYNANPTEEKKRELTELKQTMDAEILTHNERVKLFKGRDTLQRRNTVGEEYERPVFGLPAKQPWELHNQHIYQRQINKWARQREYARDVFNRHGVWLNNIKAELSRVSPMRGVHKATFQ